MCSSESTATLKNGKLSAVCFLTVVPVSLKTGSGSRLLYISLIVAAVLSLAGGGIFVWTRKKRGSQSPAEPLEAVAPIVEAGDLPASPGYAKPNFEADRIAAEVPDTLLLAEAFWLMEGYFVRTLGMHRVYNSAFMNILRDEDNAKYCVLIKTTFDFEPEILKRYVNFMNNPDEKTAVEHFLLILL